MARGIDYLRAMQPTVQCSLCRPTTIRCVKSPTASRHHSLYADASVALRRGLMLTAERYVENAGVLNDAIDAHIPSLTGASGSTRFATVCASTETRSSTGRTALLNTVIRRRCCIAITVFNGRS